MSGTHKEIYEKLVEVLDAEMSKRKEAEEVTFSPFSRGKELRWIANERRVMFEAVNAERGFQDKPPVTLARICKAEDLATGHSDYTTKFARYCAEIVWES